MTLRNKIPPPVVAVVFALIAWVLAQVLPAVTIPYRTTTALILAAAGVLLTRTAIKRFSRQQTTMNPLTPNAATTLVTEGAYRYTRNPMYVGLTLMLAGVCVYVGVLTAVIVIPGLMLYLTKFQIAPEEEAMATLFGDAYADYCARVRRWI